MAIDIVSQSSQVLAGAFLARAIYGGEYIDSAYNIGGDNDAEKADDYRGYIESQGNWLLLDASDLPTFDNRGGDARFTANGLYDAKVQAGLTNTRDAQGLLAVEGGDTLVLTFRGTDGEDPAVEDGQAFTGYSVAANYKAFRPLINAAYDYVAAHPEITKVIVSGHSLGGAMADVFAIRDAARFRDLVPDGLTIVSLASSGIPPDLPQHLGNIDESFAVLGTKTIEILPFVEVEVPVIKQLLLPSDYISIANAKDRAHFPDDFPNIPEDFGLVPIVSLKPNLHFGEDTVFEVPNIDNSDVQFYDILTHPFDFRGMGAQHNSALLWANLEGVLNDGLASKLSSHNLIIGNTNYNEVPDYNGTPLLLFEGYLNRSDPSDDNDRGSRTLYGTTGKDYILGLTGADRILAGAGDDLVSGGAGHDILRGGNGDDQLLGGAGGDRLFGDKGRDRFFFMEVNESSAKGSADIIMDFTSGEDLIHLRFLDASVSTSGDQAFEFIGDSGFTAEGQIRTVQSGNDTILRINVAGVTGREMEILLVDTLATNLTAADFIL